MKVKEVMAFYKVNYMYELAKKLDLTAQAVYEWRRDKAIPYEWQVKFSKLSKGELKIDENVKKPCKGGRLKMKNYVRKSKPKYSFFETMKVNDTHVCENGNYRSIRISASYQRNKEFSFNRLDNKIIITRIK